MTLTIKQRMTNFPPHTNLVKGWGFSCHETLGTDIAFLDFDVIAVFEGIRSNQKYLMNIFEHCQSCASLSAKWFQLSDREDRKF